MKRCSSCKRDFTPTRPNYRWCSDCARANFKARLDPRFERTVDAVAAARHAELDKQFELAIGD